MLPAHYESLGVEAEATAKEIAHAYQKRLTELHASKSPDAQEELAEVEAAYAVLRDPNRRSRYDDERQDVEAEEDKKYAALDAELSAHRHHVRKTTKGSSGWLDAIWALFDFLK
jgi:DnaJ-class molecular chaperone